MTDVGPTPPCLLLGAGPDGSDIEMEGVGEFIEGDYHANMLKLAGNHNLADGEYIISLPAQGRHPEVRYRVQLAGSYKSKLDGKITVAIIDIERLPGEPCAYGMA